MLKSFIYTNSRAYISFPNHGDPGRHDSEIFSVGRYCTTRSTSSRLTEYRSRQTWCIIHSIYYACYMFSYTTCTSYVCDLPRVELKASGGPYLEDSWVGAGIRNRNRPFLYSPNSDSHIIDQLLGWGPFLSRQHISAKHTWWNIIRHSPL